MARGGRTWWVWFAWFPVKTINNEWVWLSRVERARFGSRDFYGHREDTYYRKCET